MPSEKAPPEAKASTAPEMAHIGAFLPVFDFENAQYAHVLSIIDAPFELPPGSLPALPFAFTESLRC